MLGYESLKKEIAPNRINWGVTDKKICRQQFQDANGV